MSFNLSSFLEEPHIEEFRKLKKTELLEVGQLTLQAVCELITIKGGNQEVSFGILS